MSLLGGVANTFIQGLEEGDNLRDYQHASKTFVTGLYRLSPKYQNLFHVYIELDSTLAPGDPSEIGLLAKTATLPKFTIQNKILNAYNRKNIVQEKISYDPLTFTFHDDSADVVRSFWNNYYKFYYRDSDHTEALYAQDYKYVARQDQNWGYSPKGSTSRPYIKSIKVYSMHQKMYSGYTLIRPTITSFAHGQHTQGEYGPMEHQMTVAYEAIQYSSGPVTASAVLGFNHGHYDNTPSPLGQAGGSASILGPGGLVQSLGDVTNNLENGNFGAAALESFRTFNTFKNVNLTSVATSEALQTATNILKGQNTQSSVFVPTLSNIQTGIATATTPKPTASFSGIPNMNSQNSILPSNFSITNIASALF